MSLQDDMKTDFAAILADKGEFGDTVTISSTDYDCIVADRIEQLLLGAGGFMADYDFDVIVLKERFGGTLPAKGTQCTIKSVVYRIVEITTSEGDPCIRMSVVGKEK